MHITDLSQVRSGDLVTADYHALLRDGSPPQRYTGPAYAGAAGSAEGALMFMGLLLAHADGTPGTALVFISAERDVAPLPTEPGAVGMATVRGVPNMLVVLTVDQPNDVPWITPTGYVSGSRWHAPEDITDYVPLTLTATED